jgi:2-amino-4-hydroxy-6-hydroxymethyldihydropteridine diphosphokinase
MYAIALGANIPSRFGSAIKSLKVVARILNKKNIRIIKKSNIYFSPPKNFKSAANTFVNAAVLVETSLKPLLLLRELKKIESLMGRNVYKKNTSRTCDLDIILSKTYKKLFIMDKSFSCFIPHPQMCSRNFVLKPLLEICPNWRHPEKQRNIKTLINSNISNDILFKSHKNL